MKVSFYMLMAMSLTVTQINADEPTPLDTEKVDEVVVTSSILNTSRILNPLYVIFLIFFLSNNFSILFFIQIF